MVTMHTRRDRRRLSRGADPNFRLLTEDVRSSRNRRRQGGVSNLAKSVCSVNLVTSRDLFANLVWRCIGAGRICRPRHRTMCPVDPAKAGASELRSSSGCRIIGTRRPYRNEDHPPAMSKSAIVGLHGRPAHRFHFREVFAGFSALP